MYGMLPGCSGGVTGRMPPPPFGEYANMCSSPLGTGIENVNVQPSTFAHHALVAAGSWLARSVCVICPYRPRVNSCLRGADGRVLFRRFLALGRFFDMCH